MTLTNNGRFEQDDFSSDSPIVRESLMNWYEIPARPLRHVFEITQTDVERDDNLLISLSGITENNESFF